jgi:hypothetical protein
MIALYNERERRVTFLKEKIVDSSAFERSEFKSELENTHHCQGKGN